MTDDGTLGPNAHPLTDPFSRLGSANAIGGQAFVIKLRDTKEKSPLARVLEAPYSLLNGTHVDPSIPPRWRHMKYVRPRLPIKRST